MSRHPGGKASRETRASPSFPGVGCLDPERAEDCPKAGSDLVSDLDPPFPVFHALSIIGGLSPQPGLHPSLSLTDLWEKAGEI